MKQLIFLLLVCCGATFSASAQSGITKTFTFDGYILSQDSLPLEGAFLINYRNSKMVASDHAGYFKMVVEEGDSLMINHVSMSPVVVKVVPTYIKKAHIYVNYRTYTINPITTYDEKKQLNNLDQSMEQLNKNLKEQIIVDPTKRTGNENTYNENVNNPGATIIRVAPTVNKKDKMDKREINDQ
ncbi:MAG: hypothetical protein ACK5JD_02425 [Mangrovibacterium sp.]